MSDLDPVKLLESLGGRFARNLGRLRQRPDRRPPDPVCALRSGAMCVPALP